MALIKCPECGKEISDKATACIHCGCPIEERTEHEYIEKNDTNMKTVNGVEVDFYKIFTTYGKNKVRAAKFLIDQTGVSISEGKALIDSAYIEFLSQNSQQVHPASDEVRCPKCGSTQLSSDKKGFGIGKAVVGAALTGGIGLAAGNIGSKKIRITCLKCGKQWTAGKV